MSRYDTTAKEGMTAAYGYDHAVGYFVQVFKDGEVIVDQDSMFHNLNNGKMLELIREFGIDVTAENLNSIVFDLPF